MEWARYAARFRREAKKAGYDSEYIKRCLNYAKALHDKQLPVIYDQQHLSLLVGYSEDYLRRASNDARNFYRKFKIPKRSGEFREISEPLPSLKEIQRWILDNILYCGNVSKFAKGFIKGRSIRDNARFHRKQKMILSLDIENFFTSIPAGKVFNYLRNLGYCKSVSTMLTNLCTLGGALPQGAPTSPAFSNLLSLRIDRRLSSYALKQKIRYTRYADDLAFSGEFDVSSLIKLVEQVLHDDGLKLNATKTRLMLPHTRQEVTGIVVNERMQAPRQVRRNLRQAIYFIEKYGLDSHMEATSKFRANYVNHLRGIANFVLFINPEDKDAKHALKILSTY